MNREQFRDLAKRIRLGEASQEEILLYNAWFNSFQRETGLYEDLSNENKDLLLTSINKQIRRKSGHGWQGRRWLVAASLLMICSAGLFFYKNYRQHNISVRYANDVPAARSSATLTLAGGRKLILSDLPKGSAYTSGGIKVSKTGNGQFKYEISDVEGIPPGQTHLLSTAKGESVMISLADGSKVWLNAGSSLEFPASFKSLPSRKIAISGEAYFEVAKDARHPFIVLTPQQEIKVLGTHFNVRSYQGEQESATLIEGSVAVTCNNSCQVLRPGQRAVPTHGGLKVLDADTSLAVAWKNSMIMFEREPIRNIMNVLGRWYNVNVKYSGEPVTETYTGSIPSSESLSEVLKMLEKSGGVEFEIKGKTITVKEASSFF
ncbi:FecR family protein [Pararcticibacter amylolyticus]|uniref:Anti-sigma factor n=1 Tax=Pararcticibacter amylolyticus TaxID=2173175 RepID=A0A2U2PKM7_9SPHI|nr:FecR family protein [Pararcticibacter amylolyticus]PWG81965.1 anti-sigma factor [Pararcticibacter amylolyticus]